MEYGGIHKWWWNIWTRLTTCFFFFFCLQNKLVSQRGTHLFPLKTLAVSVFRTALTFTKNIPKEKHAVNIYWMKFCNSRWTCKLLYLKIDICISLNNSIQHICKRAKGNLFISYFFIQVPYKFSSERLKSPPLNLITHLPSWTSLLQYNINDVAGR